MVSARIFLILLVGVGLALLAMRADARHTFPADIIKKHVVGGTNGAFTGHNYKVVAFELQKRVGWQTLEALRQRHDRKIAADRARQPPPAP
uniref:Cystatin domain-containing protein n=1 Tax=Panagrellus redivivus TaxID=6233 RepID=A0A7E4VSD1_PANRE